VQPTATPIPKGWNAVTSPPVGSEGKLAAIAALSASDAWAVGYTAGAFGQGLIQHWDGSNCSIVPGSFASVGILNGVATLTSSDAWAVGNGIQHWDGSHWKAVPSAPFSGSDSGTFFGVASVAANDVWTVGGEPPLGCGGTVPALDERWHGKQWSEIPNTPDGILYSVSAVSGTDVWAVGDAYGGPHIMRWDG